MGFGFNLAFIFIIIPLTLLLGILWANSNKPVFGSAIGVLWSGIIVLAILTSILQALHKKIVLQKEDYYGEYVVKRDLFAGTQADWQYNHFRFEITTQDSIFFHVTEQDRIVKTHKGVIRTVDPYGSARLIMICSSLLIISSGIIRLHIGVKEIFTWFFFLPNSTMFSSKEDNGSR